MKDPRPPRGSLPNNRGRSSWSSDRVAIRPGTMQARIDAWPVVTQGDEAGKVQVQHNHDRRRLVSSRELPNQTETSSGGRRRIIGWDGEDDEFRIVADDPAEEGSLGFSSPGIQSF